MYQFRDPCTIIYRFACAICNKVDDSQMCQVPANGIAMVVNAPPGWTSLFSNTLICPDHTIETVLIDGKKPDEICDKFKDLPDGQYWVKWDEVGRWNIAYKYGYHWNSAGMPPGSAPWLVGDRIHEPESKIEWDWDPDKLSNENHERLKKYMLELQTKGTAK